MTVTQEIVLSLVIAICAVEAGKLVYTTLAALG
jgi:hypothetical protein